MNERTLAAVSLSNRDFPSFQAKIEDAARWVRLAAKQGADLVVLPECLTTYKGDGVGNPNRMTFAESALDDWQTSCATLIDTAKQAQVAVTVPVLIRDAAGLHNVFFLIGADGQTLGRYSKMFPTPEEVDEGVVPGGEQPLIEWGGLKVGGAICFDTCFCDGLYQQARSGADLILVPSLWPGGTDLNHFARQQSVPVALAYPAWSRIIDQTGKVVAEGGHRHETLRFGFGSPIVMTTINFDRVMLYGNLNQEKMVEVQEAHGQDVRIEFDQANCVFYLESRSEDLPVTQIIEKFDLWPYQEYFAAQRQKINAALVKHLGAGASAGSPSQSANKTNPIVSLRPLVSDGKHNAFTGLVRFKDALILTYRQSSGHGVTDGDVAVKRSTDNGQTWYDAASPFSGGEHTYYEGHLVEHNGKLLMFAGTFKRGGKLDKSTAQEFVSVSSDGETWSPKQPACDPLWRYWHPVSHGGKLYVAAYQVDLSELKPDGAIPAHCWKVKLMVSGDGLNWSDVSMISENDGGNETELVFNDDGSLSAFIRCGAGAKHLIEKRGTPPYKDWSDPIDCGQIIEGQVIKRVGGRLFMIGRFRPCDHRATTIYEDRSGVRTKIWVHDGNYWIDYAELPSGGDTSYAGLVELEPGRALVSYYSQHPYLDQPGFVDMAGASDILLAELDTTLKVGTTAVDVHV